jgi:Uma2 family endonuclease
VYLLIEVSDRTLAKDRRIKLPLYAANGIPELWIVNLVEPQIEVYTDPLGETYLRRTLQPLTGHIAPQRFPHESHQWLPDGILDLLDH